MSRNGLRAEQQSLFTSHAEMACWPCAGRSSRCCRAAHRLLQQYPGKPNCKWQYAEVLPRISPPQTLPFKFVLGASVLCSRFLLHSSHGPCLLGKKRGASKMNSIHIALIALVAAAASSLPSVALGQVRGGTHDTCIGIDAFPPDAPCFRQLHWLASGHRQLAFE